MYTPVFSLSFWADAVRTLADNERLISSFRGRPHCPVLSCGSIAFTRSPCSFVNSYRFMSLFSHFHTSCAIFIFQTNPKGITTKNNSFCNSNPSFPASSDVPAAAPFPALPKTTLRREFLHSLPRPAPSGSRLGRPAGGWPLRYT